VPEFDDASEFDGEESDAIIDKRFYQNFFEKLAMKKTSASKSPNLNNESDAVLSETSLGHKFQGQGNPKHLSKRFINKLKNLNLELSVDSDSDDTTTQASESESQQISISPTSSLQAIKDSLSSSSKISKSKSTRGINFCLKPVSGPFFETTKQRAAVKWIAPTRVVSENYDNYHTSAKDRMNDYGDYESNDPSGESDCRCLGWNQIRKFLKLTEPGPFSGPYATGTNYNIHDGGNLGRYGRGKTYVSVDNREPRIDRVDWWGGAHGRRKPGGIAESRVLVYDTSLQRYNDVEKWGTFEDWEDIMNKEEIKGTVHKVHGGFKRFPLRDTDNLRSIILAEKDVDKKGKSPAERERERLQRDELTGTASSASVVDTEQSVLKKVRPRNVVLSPWYGAFCNNWEHPDANWGASVRPDLGCSVTNLRDLKIEDILESNLKPFSEEMNNSTLDEIEGMTRYDSIKNCFARWCYVDYCKCRKHADIAPTTLFGWHDGIKKANFWGHEDGWMTHGNRFEDTYNCEENLKQLPSDSQTKIDKSMSDMQDCINFRRNDFKITVPTGHDQVEAPENLRGTTLLWEDRVKEIVERGLRGPHNPSEDARARPAPVEERLREFMFELNDELATVGELFVQTHPDDPSVQAIKDQFWSKGKAAEKCSAELETAIQTHPVSREQTPGSLHTCMKLEKIFQVANTKARLLFPDNGAAETYTLISKKRVMLTPPSDEVLSESSDSLVQNQILKNSIKSNGSPVLPSFVNRHSPRAKFLTYSYNTCMRCEDYNQHDTPEKCLQHFRCKWVNYNQEIHGQEEPHPNYERNMEGSGGTIPWLAVSNNGGYCTYIEEGYRNDVIRGNYKFTSDLEEKKKQRERRRKERERDYMKLYCKDNYSRNQASCDETLTCKWEPHAIDGEKCVPKDTDEIKRQLEDHFNCPAVERSGSGGDLLGTRSGR